MADFHQSKADKKAKNLARLIIVVALIGFGAAATYVYWGQITLYRDVLAISWASTEEKQGAAAERLFLRGEDGIEALLELAHSENDEVKSVARQVLFNHDIDIVEPAAPAPVAIKDPVEEKPAPVEEKPTPVEEKPTPVEEKPAPVEEKPAPVEEKPAPETPEKERAWF